MKSVLNYKIDRQTVTFRGNWKVKSEMKLLRKREKSVVERSKSERNHLERKEAAKFRKKQQVKNKMEYPNREKR